jgi:GDP-L-fucose synthase
LVNVGVGKDLTIRELAETIRDVVGANVELEFDASMPDGTPRKLLDTTRLTRLGWAPKHSLRQGLEKAYQWYLDNQDSFRG